jgi:pyruvate dehydrogenase E2 component (dihydrolipoamide acetyltransferase)
LFCKVEDPADIETVKNSVSIGSGIKEVKPTHSDDGNEAKAQKTSIARISPSAKLLIKEYGLDSSSLKASGSHGTLLKGDVLAAIKSGKGSSKVSSSKEKTLTSPQKASPAVLTDSSSHIEQSDSFEDLPNSQIRKVGFVELVVRFEKYFLFRLAFSMCFYAMEFVSKGYILLE